MLSDPEDDSWLVGTTKQAEIAAANAAARMRSSNGGNGGHSGTGKAAAAM